MGRNSRRMLWVLVRLVLLIVALLWVALRSCDASPEQEVSREAAATSPDPKSAPRASRSGTADPAKTSPGPLPRPHDDDHRRADVTAHEAAASAAARARTLDPEPLPEDLGRPVCVLRAVAASGSLAATEGGSVRFEAIAAGAVGTVAPVSGNAMGEPGVRLRFPAPGRYAVRAITQTTVSAEVFVDVPAREVIDVRLPADTVRVSLPPYRGTIQLVAADGTAVRLDGRAIAQTRVVGLPPGERWTVVIAGGGLVADPSEFTPPCEIDVRRAVTHNVPLWFRLEARQPEYAPPLRPLITVLTPRGTTVPRRTLALHRAADGAYTGACSIASEAGVLRVSWEGPGIQPGSAEVSVPGDGAAPTGARLDVAAENIHAMPQAARVMIATDPPLSSREPFDVFVEGRHVGRAIPGEETVVDAGAGDLLVARRERLVSPPIRADAASAVTLTASEGAYLRLRWPETAGQATADRRVMRADGMPMFVRAVAVPLRVLDFDPDVLIGPAPPGTVEFVTLVNGARAHSWTAVIAAGDVSKVIIPAIPDPAPR